MVFGLPLTLAIFVFMLVTICTFQFTVNFMGIVFLSFFQNFPNF